MALVDYATMWTSTSSIELGTSTGGTDVLGTSTDISLYMYSASMTAATMTKTRSSTGISGTSNPSGITPALASKTESGVEASSSSAAGDLATPGIFGLVLLGISCVL